MSEEHVFDYLPVYALGILDEEESSRVSAHLSDCEDCRKELQAYADTSSRLAEVVSQPMPAPDLKDKVIQRVSLASQRSAKSEPQAATTGFLEFLGSFFRRPVGAVMGLVVLLAVLFLSISTFSLW